MTGYTHLKGALGYPGMNWSVLVSVNHAGATADAHAINRNVLIAIAVCLAIIIPVGIVIGRIGVRGIARVSEAAVKLAGGALDTRVMVATKDEIGALAQAFNEMGGQLETKVTAERAQAAKMNEFMVDANRVLGKLAQGDLTEEMTHACEDELDQIKASINTAIDNLTRTMTTVRTSAETVTVGCEETNRRNEDLAERTSEQAAALEQTAASMEEMTATVKQSADNAKQANQLAAEASVLVENGSRQAAQVRATMETVTSSAKKIEGITTLIDDIATQTNKLAVDAGAGASRAGAQGRGFGIVAQEVRSLAQRSATAAREIKTLIEEFRAKLLDRRAGDDSRSDVLQGDIVTSVNKIGDIAGVIDEIALQTNMLAINAAVEAAGAGAHGQNFSAVVTEIRDLAARSAAAGRDIKGLIAASIQDIEKGNALSSQSAATLQSIEKAVTTVSRVVGQIATASQEQANGIEQVNKAVSQMDQTTQQNAALVEESTSASQLMTRQARELMRQVESFKLHASEDKKTAMPLLPKLREGTANVTYAVQGKPELGVAQSKAEKGDELVAASNNGKGRSRMGADFEEF
jgi:methyl-accepting chemotaxis protein